MKDKLQVLASNKSFCVRPFLQYSAFNGYDYRLCCSAAKPNPSISTKNLNIEEFFNSEYLNSVRQKMLAGEPIAECGSCYLLEDANTPSDRTVTNENLLERYEKTLSDAVEFPERPLTPTVLDLRVGNLCNLKCQSCFPNLSQGVYEDIKNYFGLESTLRPIGNSKPLLDSGFDLFQLMGILPGVKEIKLIGGEPSLSKPAKDLLEYCISRGISSNIELSVHTNLASDRPEFFNLLKNFKRVRLTMSLDGFGEMNEYLRFPSRWENSIIQLNRILGSYRDLDNVLLAFSPVLQVTNLFDITKLLRFFFEEVKILEEKIDLAPIPITDPDYLCALYFPKELISNAQLNFSAFYDARTQLEKDVLRPFKLYFDGLACGQPRPSLIRNFIEVTRIYDRGRGQDIYEVFPEFQTLLPFLEK